MENTLGLIGAVFLVCGLVSIPLALIFLSIYLRKQGQGGRRILALILAMILFCFGILLLRSAPGMGVSLIGLGLGLLGVGIGLIKD